VLARYRATCNRETTWHGLRIGLGLGSPCIRNHLIPNPRLSDLRSRSRCDQLITCHSHKQTSKLTQIRVRVRTCDLPGDDLALERRVRLSRRLERTREYPEHDNAVQEAAFERKSVTCHGSDSRVARNNDSTWNALMRPMRDTRVSFRRNLKTVQKNVHR